MTNKQRCIVTITDGISPTSMPFNEFVLYRLRHFPQEKQVLIQVFEKGINGDVVIPEGVEYYSLGISILNLRKTIKCLENKYDVVAYHIHEGKSVILFSLATILKYRCKSIYSIHSTFVNYPFHNKLFCFCASLLAGNVACVSKTSFKYYPPILKWLRGRHAFFIQNGVDTERIAKVNPNCDNVDKPFTIIYVARLVELKRHYILLEALRKLPDVRLLLVGIGPLEQKLRNMSVEYGIENQVEFFGLLSRETVYGMLKSTDAYVSTSSYEGLPIGVLEAMGCGMPCILSDIEQHKEIAECCPSLLFCDDDVDDWVNKISYLKKLPKDELHSIGIRNKDAVEKFFSLKTMHENYNKQYNNR